MSSQTIYTELKNADNKQLWAFAQEMDSYRRKTTEEKPKGSIDFSDKKAVEQDLYEELRKAYKSGNVAGAKEIARLLNIGEASQDIIIEVIDFAKAYTESDSASTVTA